MADRPISDDLLPELREWFDYNRAAGCLADEMIQSLVEVGYRGVDAARFVEAQFAAWERRQVAGGGFDAEPARDAGDAVDRLWRRTEVLYAFNAVDLGDRTVRLLAKNPREGIFFLPDFLSDQECEGLIAEAGGHLSDSLIFDEDDGANLLSASRSSRNGMIPRGASELARRIEARIAKLTDLPVAHGEGLQVLQYGLGGEYRPHFDFFDPETKGGSRVLARSSQRLATVIMYLSDVEGGGGTQFPELALEFSPLKGAALLFASLGRDGAPLRTSLHWGRPVTSGEKWIATKWIRVAPH